MRSVPVVAMVVGGSMFNKVILIGRPGTNAEAKTAQNKKEYAVLNLATSESWKNEQNG